jgi:hypothetical protein
LSVPTAEPTAPSFEVAQHPSAGGPAGPFAGARIYAWLAGGAILIAALSLLLPSTPSYDPWAWLVWGREIFHGGLHTPGGPTWKPLPVIFTTVFAPFGSAQPNLWLVVARASAVLAALMTFKLAARLVWWLRAEALARLAGGRTMLQRLVDFAPAVLAGLIAAVGLMLSGKLLSDSALGYSEGIATAALLIGLERHLDGHRRQAFALGFVAALDRPEIWLFWGPYGLWLMWKDPGSRKLVIGLALLTLFLWFVPQKWGGGSWTSGISRAQHPRKNSAAFASCPFCTELADHAWTLVLLRLKVAAILTIGFAGVVLARAMRARRSWGLVGLRERSLATLATCGLFGYAWWILIALETQSGFSGNDRYLVIGSGFIEICGAGGFGWLAVALAGWLSRRLTGRRTAGGRRSSLVLGATTALLALVFVFFPNWVGGNTIDLSRTHRSLVYQANLRKDLAYLINRAGGVKALKACGAGRVMVEGFQVPMVAWYFGVRTDNIFDQPNTDPQTGAARPAGAPWPNVIFQDRDTRHAALLPLPQTIVAWENQGATAFKHYVRTKTMYFFEDCAPQAGDAKMQYLS